MQGGPHNIVHYCIGGTDGDMQTYHSPNDPLFFLHHSFIDKLWNKWQTKNSNRNMFKFDGLHYEVPSQINMKSNLVHYNIPVESVLNSDSLCVRYIERGIVAQKQVVDREMTEIKVNLKFLLI